MAGRRVDRRLRPVREVDRWADGLAQELGAEQWRDLPPSQRMTAFQASGMFVLSVALLADFLRDGDLDVFERFAAAVGNVRRLLAALGLDAGEVEELDALDAALKGRDR